MPVVRHLEKLSILMPQNRKLLSKTELDFEFLYAYKKLYFQNQLFSDNVIIIGGLY